MGLIPEEIIAQVIDRCDIVEMVTSYVPLKKAGRNFKACCPFHNEKTPSFVVNPDKQIFHCFGCGVGGNIVSFIMMQERVTFPEAIRLLSRKVNVTIPESKEPNDGKANFRQQLFDVNELAVSYFHKILLSDKSKAVKKARQYLKDRNVDINVVKEFKLGFSHDMWDGLMMYLKDKKIPYDLMEKAGLIIAREGRDGHYDRFRGRIMYPIFDTRGHCRAFGARTLDEETAKYINSPETHIYTKGHHLFGFHLAKQFIQREDHVIVVEGYMDCLMPHQVGIKNVVASLGTALTVEQIRLLNIFRSNNSIVKLIYCG